MQDFVFKPFILAKTTFFSGDLEKITLLVYSPGLKSQRYSALKKHSSLLIQRTRKIPALISGKVTKLAKTARIMSGKILWSPKRHVF